MKLKIGYGYRRQRRGKAIWKLLAIPAILFGRAVVTTAKGSIEKLQRIENKVWRYLLGIGGYATVEALRGEIGASMVKSRIMETMLLYMIDTLAGDFTNVKDMMKDTLLRKKGKWFNAIEEYREELGLSWDKLEAMDRPSLKRIVRAYDTEKWKDGLRRKQSLRFYIQEKGEIHYDLCYRNNNNSMFYARARINALKLEEHKGRGIEGYNKKCKLCGEEEEDLVHFISRCEKLEPVRDYNLLDKNIRDPEERMRKLLYRDNRCWKVGKLIKDLWDLRRKLLKEIGKPTRGTLPKKAKKKTKGTKNDSGSKNV